MRDCPVEWASKTPFFGYNDEFLSWLLGGVGSAILYHFWLEY